VYGGTEAGRLHRVAQGPAQRADGDVHHDIPESGLGPDGIEQRVFGPPVVGMGPTPETGIGRIEMQGGTAPLRGRQRQLSLGRALSQPHP
jgi:hypothetical protein